MILNRSWKIAWCVWLGGLILSGCAEGPASPEGAQPKPPVVASEDQRRLPVVSTTSTTSADSSKQAAPLLPPRRRPYPPRLAIDANAAPLRIAFISYANPQQVARDTESVKQYLKPFVGRPIVANVTLEYGSSIESMRGEHTDFAFVDPLAFLMGHEQIGAQPVLLEIYYGGVAKYHSCIWVRKDSGLKTPADLRGKSIAFADQVDMSGHLLPRDVFVQQGLLPSDKLEGEFFKQVYFAGGDEQAIRSVHNGFVDAAGVSQYADLLLRPEERDEVSVIATSIDSPSHLLMARRGLDEQVIQRVKDALLALEIDQPADKAILDKLYGVQGFAEAKLSDFAAVAEVAARYGFVKDAARFSRRQ